MTKQNKTPQKKLDAVAKQRAKRNADPEKLEAHRAYMREYAKKNKDKLNARASQRYYAKRRYVYRLKNLGIEPTPELVSHIESHPDSCDICGVPGDGRWNELSIDHCHETGVYRGMLCSSCNRALGLFKDDPELLRKAAEYLKPENRKFLELSFK